MKAKLAEWGMLILLLVYIADSVNKIGHLIVGRRLQPGSRRQKSAYVFPPVEKCERPSLLDFEGNA